MRTRAALVLVSLVLTGSAWGDANPETTDDTLVPAQTTDLPAELFYATLSPEGVPELIFTHPDPAITGSDVDAWWDAFARFIVVARDQESPLAAAFAKAKTQLAELPLPDYVTFDNYSSGAGSPQGEKVRDYLRAETDRVVHEYGFAELIYVPVPKAAYDAALATFQTAQPLAPDDLFGYCPSSPTGIRVDESHPLFAQFRTRYEHDATFHDAFDRAGQRFKSGQGRFETYDGKNAYLHQVLREEGVLPSN